MVALVAAMAALLLVYGASPTHAAGSCSTTSGTTTCTFGPTGAEDTFVVPAGVSTIHVVATGGASAVGANNTAAIPSPPPTTTVTAGAGAQASADLAVSPGQTLYVNVGGTATGGNGGFNGGGNVSDTAGGGGGFFGGGAGSQVGIDGNTNTDGGGGGGSSLVFGDGTVTLSDSGPSVTISY